MDPGIAKIVVSTKRDWLAIVGLILVVVLLISILLALSLAWTAIALIAIAIILAIIGPRLVDAFLWASPEAHFHSWPLALGSQATVDIVRVRKRGNRANNPVTGWAALSCTEVATYTIGTKTYTKKATPFVNRFDVAGQRANGEVRVPLHVVIPTHAGAPSMDHQHNEIRWDLVTRLTGVTKRESEASFPIVVAPVLGAATPPVADRVDRG